MQQPTAQEVVSPSFLVDVFDRFISKTFENDSNYSFLSKEWNNFKSLLSKGSLDLEQVFRQLAQVQLNIDQFNKDQTNSPTEEKPFVENLCVTRIPSATSTNELQTSTQASTVNPKRTSFGVFDAVVSPTLRTEATYASPTVLGRTFGTAASLHTRQNTASPSLNSNVISGAASTKIQMAFLAEKARSLRQNLQSHTDQLLAAKVGKTAPSSVVKQEDRSQLRKIVLYAKTPNFQEMAKTIDGKINNRKNKDHKETFLFC